jgi:hypothetical protein
MNVEMKSKAKTKAIAHIRALIAEHSLLPSDLNFHQIKPMRWSFTRWDGTIIRGNVLTRLVWENRAYFDDADVMLRWPDRPSYESWASTWLRRVDRGEVTNWKGWCKSADIYLLAVKA